MYYFNKQAASSREFNLMLSRLVRHIAIAMKLAGRGGLSEKVYDAVFDLSGEVNDRVLDGIEAAALSSLEDVLSHIDKNLAGLFNPKAIRDSISSGKLKIMPQTKTSQTVLGQKTYIYKNSCDIDYSGVLEKIEVMLSIFRKSFAEGYRTANGYKSEETSFLTKAALSAFAKLVSSKTFFWEALESHIESGVNKLKVWDALDKNLPLLLHDRQFTKTLIKRGGEIPQTVLDTISTGLDPLDIIVVSAGNDIKFAIESSFYIHIPDNVNI